MTTTELVALLLDSGSGLILQRVPPASTPVDLASALGAAVVADLFGVRPGARVLDARRWRDFGDLDAERLLLASETERSPLVILLDCGSASALARSAPHTVSWSGGIWLPPDHPARPAQTDDEFAQGERALRMALAEQPEFAREHAGQEVGVDLLTRQLFTRSGTATALEIAREHLDDGVIYLEHLPVA